MGGMKLRQLPVNTLISAALLATAGCASGGPTAVLLTSSRGPASVSTARAVAPQSTERVTPSAQRGDAALAVETSPGQPQAVSRLQEVPEAPADDTAVPEAPDFDLGLLGSEGARRLEASGAETQSILDPWRPYGLGVVRKTARSITLAWRTDLEAKAIVYYGKSFGLSRRGYDGVKHVKKSAKVHEVTLEGLSRFRSYTFTVVGLGPLTMQFPSYPLKTRTNLF